MEFQNPWPSLFAVFGFFCWFIRWMKWGKKNDYCFHHRPEKKHINIKRLFFVLLTLLGVASWTVIGIGLAGPQVLLGKSSQETKANDLFILLDISRSMLANDFYPNRLQVAKNVINDYIKLKPSDRLSVIIFGERFYSLAPLTFDYDKIVDNLNKIEAGDLGMGTNIGDALALGFTKAKAANSKNKAIILITDGVSQVDSIDPLHVAGWAKKENIRIYTVGVGTDSEAKIPVHSNYGDYFIDLPGKSYNMEVLQKISSITDGKFYAAQDEKSFKKIFTEVNALEKSKLYQKDLSVFSDFSYYYLALGLSLLMALECIRLFFYRDLW